MTNLVQKFSEKFCKAKVPQLFPGYQVRVHQKIKEGNKERVQVFEGVVIAVNAGHGTEASFTVRKISEGIGVEKVFPIHLSSIVKIDVLRAHKVRRARLNFLRSLSGKALRLKEVPLDLKEKTFAKPQPAVQKEEVKQEAVVGQSEEAPASGEQPSQTEEPPKAEGKKEEKT